MNKYLFNILNTVFLILSIDLSAQISISKTMISGGVSREYRIYIPSVYYITSAPVPVVFNFHGYTSNNIQQELYGDFRAIADTANFILVHPQGTVIGGSTAWNTFGTIGSLPNDIGFVSDMIDSLDANYHINRNKVYATGLSNGGFMSYDLACQLSNKIAAIASVAGGQVPLHASSCNAAHPTPIMQIHGDIDQVVSYTGQGGIISCLHVDTLIKNWVNFNSCNTSPTIIQIPNINTSDNSTVQHHVYTGGTNGSSVELYKIIGGGHTWPGAAFLVTANGNTNLDFNASKEIWRFFSQYSLNNLATSISNPTYSNDLISLYPNPASNQLKITLNHSSQASVDIYSIEGHFLGHYFINEYYNSIDISKFSRGLYTAKISTENKTILFQKFVIQ